MKKLLVALSLLVLAACETVPITGRQQVSLVSDAEITSMAAREFRSFVRDSDVIKGTSEARMVAAVGRKIKGAVEEYFRRQGQGDRLAGYRWEFVLVDSEEVNAFCMPGGKVAVYSGILPIAKDEAGLAVVMGHEIAHAVANHGNERISQAMLAEAAGGALAAMLGDDGDSVGGTALQMAFGLGAEVGVLLPFSRLHESEADRLGLMFMAMAGYDPREAPKFWRRMAKGSGGGGGGGLEFLSTHPSDETRVKDLQAAMAEAMPLYRKAGRR